MNSQGGGRERTRGRELTSHYRPADICTPLVVALAATHRRTYARAPLVAFPHSRRAYRGSLWRNHPRRAFHICPRPPTRLPLPVTLTLVPETVVSLAPSHPQLFGIRRAGLLLHFSCSHRRANASYIGEDAAWIAIAAVARGNWYRGWLRSCRLPVSCPSLSGHRISEPRA